VREREDLQPPAGPESTEEEREAWEEEKEPDLARK